MNSNRKYTEELKKQILKEYDEGCLVSRIGMTYGVDTRRIYEFIKERNDKNNMEDSTSDNSSTFELKTKLNNKEQNSAQISSTNSSDLDVNDVLSKNGYSPNEWEVTNLHKNNWEDSSGKTHYQTKVSLVRKNIKVNVNTPAPIKVTLNRKVQKPIIRNNGMKCAVIIPDIQCGFRRDLLNGSLTSIHDREALDIALQITKFINPDRIVFLGDNLDLAEMSTKYLTTPDFYFTTQASLVELSWWLAQFKLINENTKIDYLAGNHEGRLGKLLNERALPFYGLKNVNDLKGSSAASIEKLLGLDDMDIEYHQYPQGKVALNSNLVCIHGDMAKGQSGATVTEVVKSARVSVIQGHIHRHEIATKTTWDAFNNFHQYTAASFGCLCKIDPGVVPGMKHLQNWQQGIGIVWYEEDGLEQFRMEYVPIINGRAIYTTEVFEANSEESICDNIETDMKYKVT